MFLFIAVVFSAVVLDQMIIFRNNNNVLRILEVGPYPTPVNISHVSCLQSVYYQNALCAPFNGVYTITPDRGVTSHIFVCYNVGARTVNDTVFNFVKGVQLFNEKIDVYIFYHMYSYPRILGLRIESYLHNWHPPALYAQLSSHYPGFVWDYYSICGSSSPSHNTLYFYDCTFTMIESESFVLMGNNNPLFDIIRDLYNLTLYYFECSNSVKIVFYIEPSTNIKRAKYEDLMVPLPCTDTCDITSKEYSRYIIKMIIRHLYNTVSGFKERVESERGQLKVVKWIGNKVSSIYNRYKKQKN